jgi:hypothetical protein
MLDYVATRAARTNVPELDKLTAAARNDRDEDFTLAVIAVTVLRDT